MNISKVNLSFGSKIKFVGEGEFIRHSMDARLDKSEKVEYPWVIEDTVCFKDRALTEGIADCNAGGINNADKVTLFHLEGYKALGQFDTIKEKLKTETDKLRQTSKPISSLIVGGLLENERSKKIFSDLKQIFSDIQLKPTIFWGQTPWGATDVFYSNKDNEDTWYIKATMQNGCCGHQHDAVSAEKIKNAFKFIHIAENDEVYVGGTQIDKKAIEQDRLY